jgi:hypothetical protein
MPANRHGISLSDPDGLERWRREGEEFERMRENRRALTRAEEERQYRTDQEFWSEVDRRVTAAVQGEREFVLQILRDALAAVNEIVDANGNKFDQLDVKLDGLAKLLQQLREGNESALQRARDLVQDLPNPLQSRRGLN